MEAQPNARVKTLPLVAERQKRKESGKSKKNQWTEILFRERKGRIFSEAKGN